MVRFAGTQTRRFSPTVIASSASTRPGIMPLRHATWGALPSDEVENRDPSVFQPVNLTRTQSFSVGCAEPLPGLRTIVARPEAVFFARVGGAATSAGGGMTTGFGGCKVCSLRHFSSAPEASGVATKATIVQTVNPDFNFRLEGFVLTELTQWQTAIRWCYRVKKYWSRSLSCPVQRNNR